MNDKLNYDIIKYSETSRISDIYNNNKSVNRKNLLLITPMLHQGGFERICVATARIMKNDYNVTIVIFSDEDIAYDVSGLNVINLDCGVQNGQFKKTLNILKRTKRLHKVENHLHTDITYSFGLSAGIVNCMAGCSTCKTKIHNADNSSIRCGSSRLIRYVGLRGYTDLESTKIMKLYARKADCMICCSKVIADEIKKRYGYKNAVTLYNPYDIEHIREDSDKGTPTLPFPDGTKILVSMGREDDVKNFGFMIRAFRSINERIPDTALMIVGEGNYLKEKKFVDELGIKNKVYFAGLQTSPYEYLKCGCAYLLTSFHEGFPNAMVEAMVLGIPVVSVNCLSGPAEILDDDAPYGAAETIYGKYGIICPEVIQANDSDSHSQSGSGQERTFADAVISLMSDSAMYRKYSDAAKERASYFSEESYRKNLKIILG